jgi:hypothetical protein
VTARALEAAELDALREELRARLDRPAPSAPKLNADPEEVQRSVARLVLTLVEFLRELMERQALRRMDAETLSDEEVENLGLSLMRLEETVHELAARFGLTPEELNLDLGPLGKLR